MGRGPGWTPASEPSLGRAGPGLLQVGLGAQPEVRGLDLILPPLACPQRGAVIVALGGLLLGLLLRTFGVAQLLNRLDEQPFDENDLRRFQVLMGSMSVILESWWRMSSRGAESDS